MKMIRSIYRIIPQNYRKRAVWVAITIFVRALLNFIGVAMLVPVLILMLDASKVKDNNYVTQISDLLGIDSYQGLVFAVCGIVLAIIVIKNILIMLLYRYERNFIFSFYKHLSKQLYVGYYNRGYEFINHNNSAHLTRNVNVVSLMFATGVLKPLAAMAGEILLLTLILIAIAIYSPSAALLTGIIFMPIVLLFYWRVRRRLNDVGVRENEIQRRKNRVVNETFRGYADIEIGGAMPHMFKRFEEAMDEIVDLRQQHATMSMLPQAFIEIGLVLGMAMIVLLSMGDGSGMGIMFGIFAVAVIRLIPAVRNIMSLWSSLKYNSYTIEQLTDANISELVAEVLSDTRKLEINESLELKNICFRYEDADKPVIEDLSLKIMRGERIGIRGASGVGKTTLFNIILGLYRPSSGDILIDGKRLTDQNRRSWQNAIGYVSQSVFITDSTIAENIAFGSGAIDHERVDKAIKLADLKDFVDALPNGIHTHIGEQGCRLSGGQRQRIGIARALYKGCNLLLFDEATSSLDRATEDNINSAIRKLSNSNHALTIIVIAHRESSLEYCDRIITLE